MALNVLVVDDSAVMRAMIIKTLHLSNIPLGEIYQAGNGLEGLQMLNENWIDLALLDINMPVMTGEEMIYKIREQSEYEDLSVIVISTEVSRTRIKALGSKNVKFIQKPFTPEMLREKIVEIIGDLNEN